LAAELLAGLAQVYRAVLWFWAYLTYRSGTRLITGAGEPAQPVAVDSRGLVRAAA
jgi:hypothetical protein